MTDLATRLPGHITHTHIGMGGIIIYSFQPEGLSPETGCPHRTIRIEGERIENHREFLEEVNVPTEILGTIVKDKFSGFTGMAVGFIRHVNGCFHVIIQPAEMNPKTQTPYPALDFDLRQCEGPAIAVKSEEEIRRSEAASPSPCEGCDYTALP